MAKKENQTTDTQTPEENGKKAIEKQYLSAREAKDISRANFRAMRAFEKEKRKRKGDETLYLTEMRDSNNIVEFDNLHTYFFTDNGTVRAVNGVSFNIPENAIVGVVGESGCGKSVTAMSLMQLVQAPHGQVVSGSIRFKSYQRVVKHGEDAQKEGQNTDTEGEKIEGTENLFPVRSESANFEEKVFDITKMPPGKLNLIRGSEVSMIFQEPMTSLNPVFTIGYQLNEIMLTHFKTTKEVAKENSLAMLELVGIADPLRVYKSYPHELSGGMRQRVMISMALIGRPRLIIADEPTTALDVTIQAQILELLKDVKNRIHGSILLITHDLGVIAEMADYVVVMYAGRIIEQGTAEEIFMQPCHPYTIGLQRSKPVMNKSVDRLYSIPGQVPNPVNMPDTCYFRDRCPKKHLCKHECSTMYPPTFKVSDTHTVACYLYQKETLKDEYLEKAVGKGAPTNQSNPKKTEKKQGTSSKIKKPARKSGAKPE